MRKILEKWKKLGVCFLAFLIVTLVFFAVGLATLGSGRGTGRSYELKIQRSGDEQRPAVEFMLENLTRLGADGETETVNIRLMEIYVSIANIYATDGTPAVLRVERRTAGSDSYTSPLDATFENVGATESSEGAVKDGFFRFVAPFDLPESGWRVSTYPFIRISAMNTGADVLVNEVVFYGEKLDSDYQGTGQFCIVPCSVYKATPYANESVQDAIERAGALIDAQRLPAKSQSSFHNFTKDEIASLVTIAEMRQGKEYAADATGNAVDSYRVDGASGALGIDILALGTAIFGMSPFGLRFFPMVASVLTLIFLARFTVRLFRSEKAGLVFSVLYALTGAVWGLGHLGTPLMIGICFFSLALLLVHKFYADGMKGTGVPAVLPLLAAGLLSACAILTNGAFILPVTGIVTLFLFGMARQQQARAYALERAIAPVPFGEEEGETPERRVGKVVAEYKFKNIAAPAFYFAGLLLGAFLISLLAMLPAFYVYLKAYVGPGASVSIFTLGWKNFSGGFTGTNGFASGNPWLFYEVYRGTGSAFAVTALVANLVAVLAAIVGGVFLAIRLVKAYRAGEKKELRQCVRRLVIPLAGCVLSLIAALAVKYAVGFVVLAAILSYSLAAGYGKEEKLDVYEIVGIVLIAAAFVIPAVFTFSIPLPASFINSVVG